MSIRLVLENAPRPQAVTEQVFEAGQLVIGRSDDADWQLDDPEMFLSRRHCILTLEDGIVMAADASSGGLYIDNAAHPVGAGNRVAVEPGMRLRLGDFVIRVEAATAAPALPPNPPASGGMRFDFDFGSPEATPEPPKRPESLPDPFGLAPSRAASAPATDEASAPPRPLDQEDPFALDLRVPRADPAPAARPYEDNDWFKGVGAAPESEAPAAPASPAGPDPVPSVVPEAPNDPFGEWTDSPPASDLPSTPPAAAPPVATDPQDAPPIDAVGPPEIAAAPPSPDIAAAPPPPRPAPPQGPQALPDEAAVFAALLTGLGLDPKDFAGVDPAEGAAQIGASMRMMTEGIMLLLRARSMNKQKARVAQTIIASADVNPLKFMATPEDALATMLQGRSRGYLGAEAAVGEAFRDLTDHQMRTWSAVQAALRKMIDKFEPAAIEAEMIDIGFLGQLMAGGKGAKLWQLYEARYSKIAAAAEQDFLGEVGADFRDAYET